MYLVSKETKLPTTCFYDHSPLSSDSLAMDDRAHAAATGRGSRLATTVPNHTRLGGAALVPHAVHRGRPPSGSPSPRVRSARQRQAGGGRVGCVNSSARQEGASWSCARQGRLAHSPCDGHGFHAKQVANIAVRENVYVGKLQTENDSVIFCSCCA